MASILIADNSLFMAGSLKFILERSGHDIVDTTSGAKEVLEKLRQRASDMLILDISMGEETESFSIMKAVRAERPKIKIIMSVSSTNEGKMDEAKTLGASGFIKKPFKYEEIEAEIKRVLK